MGNGHPEADTGGEHRLPLLDGVQNLLEITARASYEVPRQLRDRPPFVAGGERYHQPVRGQELGQQHEAAPGSMRQT